MLDPGLTADILPDTENEARRRPWLVAAVGLGLALVVATVLTHQLRALHYADVVAEFTALPRPRLLAAIGATALSYLVMTAYDALALRYAGAVVRRGTVMLTSFIAFAFSNTIGLGMLTGGAVRLRLYSAAGVETARITYAIGFIAAAFGIGVFSCAAFGLWWDARGLAAVLGLPVRLIESVAVLQSIALVVLLELCRRRRGGVLATRWPLRLPTLGLALGQLAVALFDLAAAAAALWFLLPPHTVAPAHFVASYAVAIAAGVLSHVPGGLGVFEAVILFAVGGHAPTSQVIGALLAYRAIYYLLPLVLAATLLVGHAVRAAADTPVLRAAVRLLPAVLAAILVITGMMTLVSGVTPVDADAMELLARSVPLPLVEAAHLFAAVIALAMLFVARGLVHRLDAAWWAAVALTVLAAVLALPKGVAVGEALSLAALALLLLGSRRQFDRRASLFAQRFEPGWWLCIGTVLVVSLGVLLFAYRDLHGARELWWQFEFDAHAPRGLRALMAAAVLALMVALGQLFRTARLAVGDTSGADLTRATAILDRQPSADAHLALLGDKRFLFADGDQAFLMYGQYRRSWIALFDPVGVRSAWGDLVWRFIETADAGGGRAVFYQVSAEALSLYLDAGLRVFKLGEEALVPLADFDLKGARRANLRHGVNRAERAGLRFEVIERGQVPARLPALHAVSSAWLDAHETREKGFSIGAFRDDYVARQPVAVVVQGEAILAFATLLLPTLREEASLDLMRQLPTAPNGTMDFLFARLLLYCRDLGYLRFNLGMAPMSGMVAHPLGPRWQRIGHLVFEHGERFYNFRGLRSFKEKFDPQWEPRYLASPGGLVPLLALTDIAALISGGYRGIVAK